MADDSQQLKRRVPGQARSAPAPSTRPALSPAVLRRMQAAIDAARSEEADRDDAPTGPIPRVSTSSPAATAEVGPEPGPDSVGADRSGIRGDASAPSARSALRKLRRRATPAGEPAPARQAPDRHSLEAPEPPTRTVPAYGPDDPAAIAGPAGLDPAELPRRISAKSSSGTTPSGQAQLTPSQPGPPPRTERPEAPPRTEPPEAPPRPAPRAEPAAPVLAGPAGRRRPGKGVVIAGAAVAVALAAAVPFALQNAPAAPAAASRAGARAPARSATAGQEATNRSLAVGWAAQQLSRSAVVACDQATCAALEAHGFPDKNIRVLGKSSAYPLSSTVVVATPALRSVFGRQLASQLAPDVLSRFGSGAALVTVRVTAPHGAAAYRHALTADLAVRKQTGNALLGSGQISVRPAAHQQLADGAVDTRLLYIITALAGTQPVSIVDFGNIGTEASQDLPLRYADLAEKDSASHLSPAAYLSALRAVLRGLPPEYRPLRAVTVSLEPGLAVLRVEVSAPSPLGLLGPAGQ